ncbi:MAG: aspartate kinase [Methanobrevibacter sp.]|jgi:aspartate kinase|nr:aspartate kinase [Candidatus Methanovirga aequatorialis]
MELIVVKFGGTSIGNGERIKKATQSIVNEYMKGNKIVVVVSAINKTTDDLVKIIETSIGDSVSNKQMAEILSMGEMTSVRVVSAAIESLGVKSTYIDPYNENWPILTNNKFVDAHIDIDKSVKQSERLMDVVEQGIVPVVCGFLGKSESGQITTLGRGGSDTTAFFLANSLNANQVIIVTDVRGVMTSDPNRIKDVKKLDEISVEEMMDLAINGAKVLHPNALKYKNPLLSAKIIYHESGDLSKDGTIITGPSEGEMMSYSSVYPDPITLLSIVGVNILKHVGVLAELTDTLSKNDINIFGVSTGQNSITLFVNKKDAFNAHRILHEIIVEHSNLNSISVGKKIAMLTFVSPDFIETPGIISDITEPLRKNEINIFEISSSQTAITLFVDWNDGEKAYKLIKEVLK